MLLIQMMIPLAGSGLSHRVQQYSICKCARGAWQNVKRTQKSKHLFENAPLPEQHFSPITTESCREVQLWISGNVAKFTEHFKMWISAELNYSFCSQAWTMWWMFIHSSLTVKHHPAVCWIHYILHIISLFFLTSLYTRIWDTITLWMRQWEYKKIKIKLKLGWKQPIKHLCMIFYSLYMAHVPLAIEVWDFFTWFIFCQANIVL